MRDWIPEHRPALVLAPMQDVTDLAFMRVVARRGPPDWFVTEYFRVHPGSALRRDILRSITENQTGRPVVAQMIGGDLNELVRTARALSAFPIAGIDLNLGCPAPIVCRKHAGGGLLREPHQIDRLLGGLRESFDGAFTVKTRVGHTDKREFAALLDVFSRHAIDGLTVHARTVADGYRTPVHDECVRLAVERMPCPVMANGNVVDVRTADSLLKRSGAAGLMIGRGAIRNPWIFAQIAAQQTGACMMRPTHRDLLAHIGELYDEMARETPRFVERAHVQRMKRTLVYLTHGLADGVLEHAIRRAERSADLFAICRYHLDYKIPLPSLPPLDSPIFRGFDALLGEVASLGVSEKTTPSTF
jgi:tRNA-dihydrouridine synthase